MLRSSGIFFKVPLKGIIGVSGFGYLTRRTGCSTRCMAVGSRHASCRSANGSSKYAAGPLPGCAQNQTPFHDFLSVYRAVGYAVDVCGRRALCALCGKPQCFLAVFVMSPAIFFVCVSSSYRGYYEGLRNMYPTAWSQISEALAKLACGLLFSSSAVRMGLEEYERTGTVFGEPVGTQAQAQLAVLPYGAAGAILGIVASTAVGSLFYGYTASAEGTAFPGRCWSMRRQPGGAGRFLKQLWTIAIPICLGALALNITTLIDVSSLTNRLSIALDRGGETLLAMYDGILPASMPQDEIPNYLFGAYNMSVTLFNLIPALTTTFGG